MKQVQDRCYNTNRIVNMHTYTRIQLLCHMFILLSLLSVVFIRPCSNIPCSSKHVFIRPCSNIPCSSKQKNTSSFSCSCHIHGWKRSLNRHVHGWKRSLNRAMFSIFFSFHLVALHKHHLSVGYCTWVCHSDQVHLAVPMVGIKYIDLTVGGQGWCRNLMRIQI
jgi:hypothetical protein